MLHNFLHQYCRAEYVPPCSVDVEDIETGTLYPSEWQDEDTPLALRDLPTDLTRPTMDAEIDSAKQLRAILYERRCSPVAVIIR